MVDLRQIVNIYHYKDAQNGLEVEIIKLKDLFKLLNSLKLQELLEGSRK
jgi:hypothetical protein